MWMFISTNSPFGAVNRLDAQASMTLARYRFTSSKLLATGVRSAMLGGIDDSATGTGRQIEERTMKRKCGRAPLIIMVSTSSRFADASCRGGLIGTSAQDVRRSR